MPQFPACRIVATLTLATLLPLLTMGRAAASHLVSVYPAHFPYSTWRKQNEQGAGLRDTGWANKTLYPAIDT